MINCSISLFLLVTAFTTTYEFLLASLVIFGFTSGGSAAISLGVFLDYIPLEKFAAFFGLAQLCVGLFLLFSTPILGKATLDKGNQWLLLNHFHQFLLAPTPSGIQNTVK